MIQTNILTSSPNKNVVAQLGRYSVIEHEKDISPKPGSEMAAYFASQMNVRRRQVVCDLQGQGVIVQAGAMQLMVGSLEAATDVKGVGDFFKKVASSAVTKESAIKPKYVGNGQLILEPTTKHILLEDLANWNGSMVIDDGLFLACDDTVNINTVMRSTLSSAALGGEGLFNTCLNGQGLVVLESPVPREELVVIDLNQDVAKIDGNMAIAWSNTLTFTVERTTKTLIGSAASGEGLVNVYRGTGRILVALT